MNRSSLWIASYPKSGNTWLRAILTALLRGEVDVNALLTPAMGTSRVGLEQSTGWSVSDLSETELLALRRWHDRTSSAREPGVRFRKTHDAYLSPLDGRPVVDVSTTRAAVYVVRDPRDVALSFAHHLQQPVDQVVRAMADPTYGLPRVDGRLRQQVGQHLGTWSSHVRGWLDQPDVPVLTVRYEDLHADPLGALGRVADAAGLQVRVDDGARAVTAAAFPALQAQEHAVGFTERPPEVSCFFRRGAAGQWRHDLDEGLAHAIADCHADVMRRLGYLRPPATGAA